MPVRIGQVAPSVARIERVAAMHAGLDLGLGLGIGSHDVQSTRHGPKSVPVSDRQQSTSRKTHGVQFNVTSAN